MCIVFWGQLTSPFLTNCFCQPPPTLHPHYTHTLIYWGINFKFKSKIKLLLILTLIKGSYKLPINCLGVHKVRLDSIT